jgi:serine phosphatase RsbU (regulator of sigma subunit)
VNAGHNPPYMLRAGNGALEELAAGGTIIGMFPCTAYEEASVALGADDVLFAFTDGVTEALNPAGVEFGEERLRDLLRRVHHLEADEMSAQIANELKGWMADAPRHDDLTFVLMKVK